MNLFQTINTSIWFPIVKGRLRGRRWLLGSGGKLARILTTSYEKKQTALFLELVSEGNTVLDLGANAGYYTLLASELVGRTGRVVAFEPDERSSNFLKKHTRLNHMQNVTVVTAAVGNVEGTAYFDRGEGGGGLGHLVESPTPTAVEVKTVRLDDFVQRHGLIPTHIKIDVEGVEPEVLCGAKQTLIQSRPILFLSISAEEDYEPCCDFIRALNYEVEPISPKQPGEGGDVICRPYKTIEDFE